MSSFVVCVVRGRPTTATSLHSRLHFYFTSRECERVNSRKVKERRMSMDVWLEVEAKEFVVIKEMVGVVDCPWERQCVCAQPAS